MEKLYKCLFSLFVLLFLININAKAVRIYGSHIGYKAIDSTNYEVTLTIYRDCNGIPINDVKVGVTGKTTGYFEVTANKVSATDITGAYLNCNFVSRCTGTYHYGIEKLIYKDTVNISGGACEYKFSYKECCRNSNITTGAANTLHHNFATINKCFGINNSVQADIDPQILVAVGTDISMSTLLGDRVDSEDSVVFSLEDPYKDSVTKASYSGSWSKDRPISFLGFPNTNLNSPAGFHFNKTTGDIQFRPTVQNQVSVFCTEAKEYREVNGKIELVGVTRLEHLVLVVPTPNNKPPKIIGQSAVACTGQKTCIDFETDDADANDSTFINFTGLPSGATVTYGRKGKKATAQVCYTPTKNDIKSTPYSFIASASDNTCSIGGRSIETFTIKVQEGPDSTNVKVLSKTVSCSSADIIVQLNTTSSLTGLTWEIFDEDNISKSTNDTAKLFFKGSGWKKFYAVVKASNSLCTFTIEDSVFINPQYSLNFNPTKDSTLCTPTSLTIAANVQNGTSPYVYNWTKANSNFKANTAQITQNISTTGSHKYFVMVSDSNGCIGDDSVVITLNNPLIIDAGNYSSICGGSGSVQLQAQVSSGTSPFSYTWLPGNATTDTFTVSPNTTTNYILKVEDNSGCTVYDTATIIVAPSASFTPPNTSQVCEGNPLTLQVTNIVGASPVSFTWDGTPSSGTYTFSPKQSGAVVIEMTDNNNCKATRFVQVVVNQNPEVELGLPKTVCRGTAQFIKANPTKGKAPYTFAWSNSVTTDSFTTVINFPRQFVVTVTDDNGCIATDNILFQVFPKGNPNIVKLPVQCEVGNPVALVPSSGGVWSGPGVSGGNLFIPQLAGKGIHKLEYNYTSTFGCAEKADQYVVVKSQPIPDFTVDKTKGVPNTQFNFTNQTTADSTYTIAWDFGDFGAPGNVSLLANPSFTYTRKGLYTVKLTVFDGVCDPVTETKVDYILVDSSTISVAELDKLNLNVYPNPAKTSITVEANSTIDVVDIFDVTGKKIFTKTEINTTATVINISTLSDGVYLLRAELKNGSLISKKIKILH